MSAPWFIEVPVYRDRWQSHEAGGGGMVETEPAVEVLNVGAIVRWHAVTNEGETIVHLTGGAGDNHRRRVKMTPAAFEALVQRANDGRAVLRPDVRKATGMPGEGRSALGPTATRHPAAPGVDASDPHNHGLLR